MVVVLDLRSKVSLGSTAGPHETEREREAWGEERMERGGGGKEMERNRMGRGKEVVFPHQKN